MVHICLNQTQWFRSQLSRGLHSNVCVYDCFSHRSVTIQSWGVSTSKCRPLGALIFASCAWACTKLEAKAIWNQQWYSRHWDIIWWHTLCFMFLHFFATFLNGRVNHEIFERLAFCLDFCWSFHMFRSNGAQLPWGIWWLSLPQQSFQRLPGQNEGPWRMATNVSKWWNKRGQHLTVLITIYYNMV